MEYVLSNIFICFPLCLLSNIKDYISFCGIRGYFLILLMFNLLKCLHEYYPDYLFMFEIKNINNTYYINNLNLLINYYYLMKSCRISIIFLLYLMINIFYLICYLNSEDEFEIRFILNTTIYYNLFLILRFQNKFVILKRMG